MTFKKREKDHIIGFIGWLKEGISEVNTNTLYFLGTELIHKDHTEMAS
ncbi:hypothetical protein WMZ97_17470 [Lentibacillus sp. N15]